MYIKRRWSMVVAVGLVVVQSVSAYAFSINDEIKLGKMASQEVEKEMPLSKNAKWQSDIQAMGQRFMPFIARKGIPYTFKVVDAKEQINAFALPGGFVYFTERMWRIMTPDERAAVLAHEITHCDKRHGVDQELKSRQRSLWLLPLIILGGPAVAEVAMVGNMAVAQRYSRKMEREADENGIKLMSEAGFNPAGTVTSMKKLLNIESDQNHYEISSIFASHPDTIKRVEYLTESAIKLGAKPESLELKAVDDPSRIGNITSCRIDTAIVTASTSVPLAHGQRVLIKKMLWDDDAQALKPKTVCAAVVLAPGKLPILSLRKQEGHNFTDVMEGDGVYPDEAPPSDVLPIETPSK